MDSGPGGAMLSARLLWYLVTGDTCSWQVRVCSCRVVIMVITGHYWQSWCSRHGERHVSCCAVMIMVAGHYWLLTMPRFEACSLQVCHDNDNWSLSPVGIWASCHWQTNSNLGQTSALVKEPTGHVERVYYLWFWKGCHDNRSLSPRVLLSWL